MIRTLRTIFLGRPAREKILIVVLLLGGAVLWGMSLVNRAVDFTATAGDTSRTLDAQLNLISHKDRVEKRAVTEAAHLDPTQTLDSLRLTGTVQQIARDSGLTGFNSSPAQDVSNGQFAFHSVLFSVNKATYPQIEDFYYRLQDRAPYIGIETFHLAADRSNPAMLNASMTISSVEIVHGATP
jgi:hypothetical protein